MSKETPNGKGRRRFSAEQKYRVVKEKLTTDQSVSEICKKYGISPALYYRWQEQFLESAKEGLARGGGKPSKAEQRKIEEQEQDLQRMQRVIAEITAENIEFKKKFSGY
jgi:transposase-like protein